MPIISLDYTFYYDWNQNMETIIKEIGYWRYYAASLTPLILYSICLPIILLGEVNLII